MTPTIRILKFEDDSVCKGFDQQELNDLVRDSGSTKRVSWVLAKRLHEKNLFEKVATVYYFRLRGSAFLKDFYCKTVHH